MKFFLLSIVTILSLSLNLKLLNERQAFKPASFKVLEVLDGDTFKIQSGSESQRVRLMGVNTPEAEKCGSGQATKKLKEMVLNKNVTLTDQFNDPYGRIMANVFVGKTYVNAEMLKLGLGRMDYYQNPHREELKAAYAQARTNKLGLFSQTCLSLTPPAGCLIKGNVDNNTKKKFYLLPTCRNYSLATIDLSLDEAWFCSESEAVKAGFLKSPTCK